MKKMINKEHIEGRVYEHNLAVKTVQNTESKNYGKEFIGGTLDIATDEACENIVTVTFTYVTETTSKGAKNDTYTALKNIIDNGKCVLVDGKDNATMVKVDTALGLNDFYTNRDGQETLVSAKRNEGGFVHIVTSLGEENTRNTFEVDMLINGTREIEADEENGKDGYLVVKGAVFNFRNAILPVEFAVRSEGGMKYFENLDASPSNLVFTKVWGRIVSEQKEVKSVEESAFGEANEKSYTRSFKEWLITGAASETYEIAEDEEAHLKPSEIQTAMTDRNTYLADVKKRSDEYQAQKAAKPAAGAVSANVGADAFNF